MYTEAISHPKKSMNSEKNTRRINIVIFGDRNRKYDIKRRLVNVRQDSRIFLMLIIRLTVLHRSNFRYRG